MTHLHTRISLFSFLNIYNPLTRVSLSLSSLSLYFLLRFLSNCVEHNTVVADAESRELVGNRWVNEVSDLKWRSNDNHDINILISQSEHVQNYLSLQITKNTYLGRPYSPFNPNLYIFFVMNHCKIFWKKNILTIYW